MSTGLEGGGSHLVVREELSEGSGVAPSLHPCPHNAHGGWRAGEQRTHCTHRGRRCPHVGHRHSVNKLQALHVHWEGTAVLQQSLLTACSAPVAGSNTSTMACTVGSPRTGFAAYTVHSFAPRPAHWEE